MTATAYQPKTFEEALSDLRHATHVADLTPARLATRDRDLAPVLYPNVRFLPTVTITVTDIDN